MKFAALATLATLSAAIKVKDDYWDCYGEWIWEDCSDSYWQENLCEAKEGEDRPGWWYSPEADQDGSDDEWITLEEYESWEDCNGEGHFSNPCENEWLETAAGNWYRDPCDGEWETDCGWIYWGEDDAPDYWWSCEEAEAW